MVNVHKQTAKSECDETRDSISVATAVSSILTRWQLQYLTAAM